MCIHYDFSLVRYPLSDEGNKPPIDYFLKDPKTIPDIYTSKRLYSTLQTLSISNNKSVIDS